MLPGYAPASNGNGDEGLLVYSAASKDWAAVKSNDPRPKHVPVGTQRSFADRRWLAAVLRSEFTNAGELPLADDGSCTPSAWMLSSAFACDCTS
jgi:hypothetical protein